MIGYARCVVCVSTCIRDVAYVAAVDVERELVLAALVLTALVLTAVVVAAFVAVALVVAAFVVEAVVLLYVQRE